MTKPTRHTSTTVQCGQASGNEIVTRVQRAPEAEVGVLRQRLISVEDSAAMVIAELRHRESLSVQTQIRVFGLINRFARFAATGCGSECLAAVSTQHVAAFVTAVNIGDGGRPSVATMRLRRWALRLFFRVARDLELTNTDPTLDVRLPGRTRRSLRPLSDDEVDRCRRAALHDLSGTRLSVAWALGEATTRTSEIPHVRIRDVDLEQSHVWIHGSRLTTPRFGSLSTWGLQQVQRRLHELGENADPDACFTENGRGNRESRVSFSAETLRETLVRAGIAPAPRVGAASIAGWAGVRLFSAAGRIEEVARALGVRSLDAATRLIDWDWCSEVGPDEDG